MMDKLKIILEFLKKYHFWFLSGSMVIIALLCWWLSTGSLAAQFQERAKAIDNQFSGVKAIIDNPQHPNQKFIDAVNERHEELKKGVFEVWEVLDREQKEKNPWPGVLGKRFIEKINALGPHEPIPLEMREQYQNFIKDYFPTLFNIVDLRRPAETMKENGTGAADAGGGAISGRSGRSTRIVTPRGYRTDTGMDSMTMVGVVDWDEEEQVRLENRFEWKRTPSSEQVRLAQEDLWVYETLLRVIRETNSEKNEKGETVYITEQSRAAIKQINALDIGADAVKEWKLADQAVFRAPVSQTEQDQTSLVTPRETSSQRDEQLQTGRYVDDKGAPLEADAVHPYAEFKMMPISMKLKMDQRKITKLLVECANRAMPIEVRRVRFRPGEYEVLDFGSMSSTSPLQTSPISRSIYDRAATSSRTMRTTPAAGGTVETQEMSPLDIPLEIQGIIYIYNSPDRSMLGTGTAGEKPLEAAPPATPTAPAGGTGAPPAAAETAPPNAPEAAPTTPPATE